LNNLGRLLEIRKDFPESEAMFTRSLLLDSTQTGVLTHWIHIRQKQCKWPVYADHIKIANKDLIEATSAVAMLSASDDPALQLAAAKKFVTEKVSAPEPPLANLNGYGHKKLRIGYLSSNFNIHAVSLITVEIYELHDRERVEVYAFCWSGEDVTTYRHRIATAVDHYIRIADMSDHEAAECIRAHEIDILVDLQGLTSGARPNILSARPAPIQISYLGFPGTTGLPCNDYVIADKFVLPPELTTSFSEKPLYMPNSFQVSDRGRQVGARPNRADCGLPENAFVFCSFNNNFKFTPEVFGAWMRILELVPDSVLWLLADNPWAEENLFKSAEAFGIKRERLIFAGRVTPADYLARYQAADLFLDTFPFNAGTTANDALWMGLPLLTYSGRAFASRMAGSLLTALGLPELITFSLEDYERQAVSLARNKARVEEIKQHLRESRNVSPLFDIPQFVRDLEDLFSQMSVN
jgi:predicted O-linked N-acetylglucosamine transferase (SPINDLY family)